MRRGGGGAVEVWRPENWNSPDTVCRAGREGWVGGPDWGGEGDQATPGESLG